MFRKSYQPRLLRENLLELTYGHRAGDFSDTFDILRRAMLKRDDQAPIYPTAEDLQSFEERDDVRHLRAQYAAIVLDSNADTKEAKRAATETRDLIRTLSNLAVQRNRRAYFEAADTRRNLGISTADLATATPNPYKSRHSTSIPAAVYIGQLLCQDKDEEPSGGQRIRAHLVDQLVLYLVGRFTDVEAAAAASHSAPIRSALVDSQAPAPSTCLLCRSTFSRRGNLTRHYKTHLDSGIFNQPFPCPVYKKLVDGPSGWSNHVESAHGRPNAPNLLSSPDPQKPPSRSARKPRSRSARCFICRSYFFPGNSFSRHMNSEHRSFEKPFPCPECSEHGREEIIHDRSAWLEHTSSAHGCDGQTGSPISATICRRKRSWDSANEGNALKRVKTKSAEGGSGAGETASTRLCLQET